MNAETLNSKSEIAALPLRLVPLSNQIEEAGGEGFNCDVVVKPMKNSFSVLYTFWTKDGIKTLKTRNEFQVGMVEDVENHFVIFDADIGEYTLVTPRDIKKEPYRILLIKSLGNSFNEI
jgi:hypothetical protein